MRDGCSPRALGKVRERHGDDSAWVPASARRQIPERVFQRREPRLEVSPLVDALFVYGLAHLFGTRRAHAALGLVELQTRGLELEAAELEYPPDVALEALDYVLVLDTQDLSREHRVPVLHQLDVGAVVASYVLEAVSELLACREQLLEVAEAAGHRLATRVDDFRVRQDQVDQAEVPEVVRHLVDEEGLAGAEHPRVLGVLLAEGPQLIRVEPRQHRRVARPRFVGLASLQVVHEPRDVRELHRALHQRVRGEYLFDQGRSGARQADDEDRVRPVAAEALPGCEEFGGADLRLQRRITPDPPGLVPALALLECVAALVVAEGLGVLPALLECLAEREAEVIAIHETRRRGGLGAP